MKLSFRPTMSKILFIGALLGLLTVGACKPVPLEPNARKPDTHTNRLIHEKSPYLLQHAHNPVDWYAWGEEAFAKAEQADKPVFLSIGYSTCHWCHVMEEESFSNPEIAGIMNRNFISIKVDREERPDVDHVYMQAVMAITGSGGWPLSVFLTPERKPFYGGTYFPPEDRWGRPGLKTILNAVHEKWTNEREKIVSSSEELSRLIQDSLVQSEDAGLELSLETLTEAYRQLESRYDGEFAGFGGAPKFPQAHMLSFLLRYWKRTGEGKALEMAAETLKRMARGGIYDHLGGGFHRYSTDREWHIPHFEKMLYDQAILARAYLEAHQAAGNEEFARLAREIFDYVLRGMTHPEGPFYSAEDADSAPDPRKPDEKSEGAFYLWKAGAVESLLGPERAEVFNYAYGVEADGNAKTDPEGEFKGNNILYLAHTPDEVRGKFGADTADTEAVLEEAKEILFLERAKRARPHLDDKVLTDWNGLMISSLAFGARVLDEPRYAEAAKRAADFILANCVIAAPRNDKRGRLMHRYRDGEVAIPAFLEDYAFFSNGLIDLYEATFEPKYLEEARVLLEEMIRLFWDESGGGFFLSGRDAEALISRAKEIYDGALPSGNSVAALSLLRLGRMTADRSLEAKADETLKAFSHSLAQFPSGYTQMLNALDFALGPSREIIIAGDEAGEETRRMIRAVFDVFLPNKVVLLRTGDGARIAKLAPYTQLQTMLDGKPAAYVCRNYICDLPVTEAGKLAELLRK